MSNSRAGYNSSNNSGYHSSATQGSYSSSGNSGSSINTNYSSTSSIYPSNSYYSRPGGQTFFAAQKPHHHSPRTDYIEPTCCTIV